MSDPRPFRLFGPDHVAVLLLIAAGALVLVRLARRGPERRNAWLASVLSVALVVYAVTAYVQKGLAGELSWDYALPLELCHWVLIACVLALLLRWTVAAEIAYFWGTAGTLASALTPDITEGFPSWDFVLFYWSHGGILLAVAFLFARGFRPARGSIVRVLAALNVYAVVVGAIDWWFGWNYGYLCSKPNHPSPLDFLGPWPWYLLSLEPVAVISFWILWRIARPRPSVAR